MLSVDGDAWRRWSNIHPYLMRHGVPLEELTPAQRERGLALLAACLSERGFATVRDVMRLNHFIGEVTGRWEEYWRVALLAQRDGTPSASDPWGWQIDGHHLSSLLRARRSARDDADVSRLRAGHGGQRKFAGIRVFGAEEAKGLAHACVIAGAAGAGHAGHELPVELFTAAFRDNFEMKYEASVTTTSRAPSKRASADLLDV